MAKQVSKTVIGVFVISSIAMLVAGVIIFGGGDMFKKTVNYVLFFDESVKGLSVGAPVIWQGVEVGSVSAIVLRADATKLTVSVPVVIEVDPSRMEIEGERINKQAENMKLLIAKGLRARLALQSFVTGSSMIEVEFFPNTPIRLTGLDSRYPEIPTVRSPMDKLAQKLEDLPIEKIAGKLVDILDNLDKLLGDPEIKEIRHNLNTASQKLDQLIGNADKLVLETGDRVNQISDSLQATLTDGRTLMKDASKDLDGVSSDARKLLQDADVGIRPLLKDIQAALVSAKKAMDGATNTLVHVDGLVGERSDTRQKLNRTLDEFSAAAKSLKSLMDYLERHPESLLKGKGGAR